jgi:hypothetical protein
MIRNATLVPSFLLAAIVCQISFGQQPTEMPREVRQELRYFAGTWRYVATTNGAVTEGRVSNRWGQGRYCLFGSLAPETGDVAFSYILGWDKSTGWLTERGCSPGGGSYKLTWKRESDSVTLGEATGQDGDRTWTGSYKLEKEGNDGFSVTGVYTLGDKELDWHVKFTRVPTAKQPEREQ